MTNKTLNCENLLYNLNLCESDYEIYLTNKIAEIEGLTELKIGYELISKYTTINNKHYGTTYGTHDTTTHPALNDTLYSKLKLNKNILKIVSIELFTNTSTKSYTNLLTQEIVINFSQNSGSTRELIQNIFYANGIKTKLVDIMSTKILKIKADTNTTFMILKQVFENINNSKIGWV